MPTRRQFAAGAMQFRFERALSGPLRRDQRFVEDHERAADITCSKFGFGESNLEESVEERRPAPERRYSAHRQTPRRPPPPPRARRRDTGVARYAYRRV